MSKTSELSKQFYAIEAKRKKKKKRKLRQLRLLRQKTLFVVCFEQRDSPMHHKAGADMLTSLKASVVTHLWAKVMDGW